MQVQAKDIQMGATFYNPFTGHTSIRVTFRGEDVVTDKISQLPCIVCYDTEKHNVHHIMCNNHVFTEATIEEHLRKEHMAAMLAVERVF